MQPSPLLSPSSRQIPSSIFDAIKYGDWEGLLALYATSAYDAVHSAEFARRGSIGGISAVGGARRGGFHRSHSMPLTPTDDCGSRKGIFIEEKKMDASHDLTSHSHGAYNSPPPSSDSSSSVLWELEMIVREILGAEIAVSSRQRRESCNSLSSTTTTPSSSESSNVDQKAHSTSTKRAVGQQPNKRKSPHHHGLPSLDYSTLFHNTAIPRSNSSERCEREASEWEKIMWDCASGLSNSAPSPSFEATTQDRVNRNCRRDSTVEEEDDAKQGGEDDDVALKHQQPPSRNTPIFEGNNALATPGDLAEGGTGSGTAQHLACVLDSPLALAILLVMGVNVEARHTAFRRLAIHEAACADSPECLRLIMEVGTRSYMELFGEEAVDVEPSAPSPSLVTRSVGQNSLKSTSSLFANATSAVSNSTGLSSFEESIASEVGEMRTSQREKSGKKKVSLFSGLQKGKIACKSFSTTKTNLLIDGEKVTETTSFPVALRVMRNATQFFRSGEMNEVDTARYILERLKVSSKSMLTLALQCPHLPLVKRKNEDRPNSFSLGSIPTVSAANHLFRTNHRDMQNLFVKRNVDGHGNTPLHWAAFKDSVHAIDILLSYNVDVNTRAQPSGWAPLHDAAYSDASNAVARLIAAGASVDARSHSGATPLCFAAQEDSPNATRLLLKAGADPSLRCLGNSPGLFIRANNADNHQFHSRFSGYTPLHYCAHYNAVNAARVLLYDSQQYHHYSARELLEIPDLNEKLPIHVAVVRGSSLVLKEFLHGGARVETSSYHPPTSPRARSASRDVIASATATAPVPIPISTSQQQHVVTPVSSPILRSMIPAQPITSTKPWNCLSQTSIDACKHLIEEVEMNWTPTRHTLFCPTDRQAIMELLRVGKRLEQAGRGIFVDLWPRVLSFCGRGWFEPIENEAGCKAMSCKTSNKGDNISLQCLAAEMEDFVQFELDGTSSIL